MQGGDFMEHSYRFRIYPTKEQTIQIQRTFGCCRFVYNYYLAKRIDAYKSDKTTLGYKACSADMTALKKQLPCAASFSQKAPSRSQSAEFSCLPAFSCTFLCSSRSTPCSPAPSPRRTTPTP